MPQFLINKLKQEARQQGKAGKNVGRYVYGALNNMGAMHGNKETPKGKAMDAKHKKDKKKNGKVSGKNNSSK